MDEAAQFIYLKSIPLYERETPYHNFINGRTNIVSETAPPQQVRDIRDEVHDFKLGIHGFEYRRRSLPVVNWEDEDDIKRTYIEDLKMFASDLIPEPVERCEMFDFRLRSAVALQDQAPEHPGLGGTYKMAPAMLVHVDQSPQGVLDWMHRELGPEETARIAENHRLRVINIWRPLVDVVTDMPLAMCDTRTVKPSDLVGSAHISADYVRRNFLVKYSQEHEYYYLSRMTKEEICAFIVFDSAAVGGDQVRTPPHSAFCHSGKWRSDEHPRESIEVRFLVLSALEEH
ncbi:hypothetical protein BDV06DRAFT_226680 [Aspergillus oleicola]